MVDINTSLAGLLQSSFGLQDAGGSRRTTVVNPLAEQARQAGASARAGADTFDIVGGVRSELQGFNADNRQLQQAIGATQVALSTARAIEERLVEARDLTLLAGNESLSDEQFEEIDSEYNRVIGEISDLVRIAGEQEQNLVGSGSSNLNVNSSVQPEFELGVEAFDFDFSVSSLLEREVTLSGVRDDAILTPDEGGETEPPDPGEEGEVPFLDRRFTRDLLFNVVREFVGISERFSRSDEFIRDLASDINETTRGFEEEQGDRPGPGGRISVGFVAAGTLLAIGQLNAEREGEEFNSPFFNGARGEELRELSSRIADDIREAFNAAPSGDSDGTGDTDGTDTGTGTDGSGSDGGSSGDGTSGSGDDGTDISDVGSSLDSFLPPIVSSLAAIDGAQTEVETGIQELEGDLELLQNQLSFNEGIQGVLREQFEATQDLETEQALAVAGQIGAALSLEDLSIGNERPDNVLSLFEGSSSILNSLSAPTGNDDNQFGGSSDDGTRNAIAAFGSFAG